MRNFTANANRNSGNTDTDDHHWAGVNANLYAGTTTYLHAHFNSDEHARTIGYA